jgi:pimeloyl-ACP methyl ester carboxylesterase
MDRLEEIDVPILIISGEDDNLTPPKYADYLRKNIKNARLVRIMDAGHLAPAEKPKEVNQAIGDFLEEI